MTMASAPPFNQWLRGQLRARRMSQRQLAAQTGVNHSTISRLVRGTRTPSLETATRLARGLREVASESDTPVYFDRLASAPAHPAARVEYALRADEALSEDEVRRLMALYIAVRQRREGTAYADARGLDSGDHGNGRAPVSGNGHRHGNGQRGANGRAYPSAERVAAVSGRVLADRT
jgi:transcriptional regulator with XRE-family HTH domain